MPRPDEYTTVTRADGRAFNVRLLRKGDMHGNAGRPLAWPVTYRADPEVAAEFANKLGVEIFDAKHAGEERFDIGGLGQFTGGRYYVDDFLEPTWPGRGGLRMHGDVPEWHLDQQAYAEAVAWVKARLEASVMEPMSLPLIGIDYDETTQESYRAVVLELPGCEPERFATGDPPADHAAALRRYCEWMAERGISTDHWRLMGRSSMDHFAFDGDRWTFGDGVLEDVPLAGGERVDVTIEMLRPAE